MKTEKIISIKKIGIEETSDLVVEKNHNYIANGILVHNSGYGKGLAGEGIVEKLHKAKYIVIVIADPKDELEYCYQMFKPREMYHLDHLRKIGKKPEKKKVKIYHPFTFNIPNINLPNINFYTLPLKELGRKEWSLLAETGWDTETMRLLLQASQNISKEDGLYGIVHYIQNAVRGKHVGRSKKADPRNFYLEASSGTLKAVTEISNYLQPFKRDYFLTKDSCLLNLNWKQILSDQENYHVFVSNWIRDEKLKDFLVLALLNGILEHKNILKNPVIIVLPEIRKQCPFRPQGHKFFLANAVKDSLSLMRASGRGMSSILDSIVFIDIDESVRNSATTTLLGELGGGGDMEKVAKAFNYKRDIRDQLKKTDYPNSYLKVGSEDVGGLTMFFSSSCHAEPNYNFFEMYKQEYPKQMKMYTDVINSMKKMYKEEVNKFKEKIKRKEKEEKERKKREAKEKEESQKEREGVEGKIEKAKTIESESKEKIMKLCYEMYNDKSIDSKDKTYRKIGIKFGLNHVTVKKYVDKYSELIEKEEGEDFGDKVLEDLKADANEEDN